MSKQEISPAIESAVKANEGPMGDCGDFQKIQLMNDERREQELTKMIDELFPDIENINLRSVSAARSRVVRMRTDLELKKEQVNIECEKIGQKQKEKFEEMETLCDEALNSTSERLSLNEPDAEKLSDALEKASGCGNKAIYYIALWLIERLDDKLNSLFSVLKKNKKGGQSNGSDPIWDERVALGHYLELHQLQLATQNSNCRHLVNFLNNIVEHWFEQLHSEIGQSVANKLTSIKFPFSAASLPCPREFTKSPFPLDMKELVDNCRFLLELQPPLGWKNEEFEIIADEQKISPLLVLKLTEPMLKRFRYHFYGKRPTNSPEHPEWYHTQILSWLESNSAFVKALFNEIALSMDMTRESQSKLRVLLYKSWSNSVAKLASEKLQLDIPALVEVDSIFAHLIDETLLFRNSLFSFLTNEGNDDRLREIDPVKCLLNSVVFDRWLEVERRYALQRIDNFLAKADALQIITEKLNSNANDAVGEQVSMAPNCVIDFSALVSGLLDRCELIMQVTIEQQENIDADLKPDLNFIQLILNLVDGFRIRLLQLGRSADILSNRGLALLAAAGHLEEALSVDWMHRPVVVACSEKLDVSMPIKSTVAPKSPSRMDGSVQSFSDEAALFARAVRELADDVVSALEIELTQACVAAADDHDRGDQSGVDLPDENASHHVSLTVVHCAAVALHNLLDRLRIGLGGSSALRRLIGTRLATRVDAVLFANTFERVSARHGVISQNVAKELADFVKTRVVYLLSRHLCRPNQPASGRLLPRMNDSLHLLASVSEGAAKLMRNTLSTSEVSNAEILSSLEEIGCTSFAKSSDGPRLASLVLTVRFGAAA